MASEKVTGPGQETASPQASHHDDEVDSVIEQSLTSIQNDGEAARAENLPERLNAMEKKMKRIDDFFGFQPLAMKSEEEFSDSSSDESDSSTDKAFLFNTSKFMRETLVAHLRLRDSKMRFKRARKMARKAVKRDPAPPPEDDAEHQICKAAFIKGEPATVAWVDWDLFIADTGESEKLYMTPIQVPIGEPDQHFIASSQLNSQVIKGQSSTIRGSLFGSIGIDDSKQAPLPERIKLCSIALRWACTEQFGLPYIPVNRPIAILRPFKLIIYHENVLRKRLARLERRFENWDGKGTAKKEDNDITTENGSKETNYGYLGEGVRNSVVALLHLRCLIKFLDTKIKPRIQHIESYQCRKILFSDLWHLFKPGNEVVDQTEKQAYRIIRVQTPPHRVEEPWKRWPLNQFGNEKEKEDIIPMTVHCVYIDFDGKNLGPVSVKFSITSFGGLKDIKSLPIYPLRFSKDANLRNNLVTRGKMLLNIATFKSMYYKGFTLDTRDEIDSQVVVDFSEALSDGDRKQWAPNIGSLWTFNDDNEKYIGLDCDGPCCGSHIYNSSGANIDLELTNNFLRKLMPSASFRAPSLMFSPRLLEDAKPGTETEPTEDELAVMTYRAFAFVLRSRKWAQLDLTFLKYEDTDARNSTLSAFDRLELPEGHRQMVKSLVTQHFRNRHAMFAKYDQSDLVRGKGKGLIILLHGAPGVGKTTTAEGVAELFKKPLFQITCGDLGTTARNVEQELEKNFALASRWGCILLLDEADVFLSARERKDFERNGLVSVFLRVLEYYSGILFLTTNRIGDFDEAFASRIHMSLYYPELDEHKTKRVFKLNLDLIQERFDKQGRKIIYDASSIEDFAKQHFRDHEYSRWNGRQIRNACQTALALAEFDAHGGKIQSEEDTEITVALQLKHFRLVQTAYLDFGHYLGDIRGTQGDRRAIDYGLRAKSNTPYQTTPNRFSMAATRESHYSGSLSAERDSNYTHSYPPQGGQRGDPLRPLINQSRYGGGGGSDYGAGGSSNMGHQMHEQYDSQQGQMGPGGRYGGYDSPRGHDYMHLGNQQGQMDSRFYQQSNQQGQNWGSANPGMNQGYPPTGPSQHAQGYGQNPRGQNPQEQQHQGQPQYSHGNVQQGGVIQSQQMPGSDFTGQNQFSQVGPGSGLEGAGLHFHL
ncbi:hypothetical protein F4825DRAFT_441591 [Nemania diffusa]|nr:hypothetical protein F4825DRAFT_441591 [Nemania diffusa]